jgi:hypothetical protein
MGVRVECDWCRQTIKAGDPYITVAIDGKIKKGGHDVEDLSQPARVYCGADRYEDDDPAGRGYLGWEHRLSCAQRVLTALAGNPEGRVDVGLEWRLVPQVAPRPERLVNGSIADLKLSGRTVKALRTAGVATIHDLAVLTEAEWAAIRGITFDGGVQDIRNALHSHACSRPKKTLTAVQTPDAAVAV